MPRTLGAPQELPHIVHSADATGSSPTASSAAQEADVLVGDLARRIIDNCAHPDFGSALVSWVRG